MRHLLALSALLALAVAPFASAAAPPAPPRFITALRAGTPQHVVIYGTSLSKGGAWVPQLRATFDARFPGLVTLTNSARGGQHSGWGAAHVDSAVIALKPDVVFFGENVPKDRVERCYAAVEALAEQSGALLVVGSSLTVMSGLRFVRRAAARAVPVVIVTRGRTRGDPLATYAVESGCTEFLAALA